MALNQPEKLTPIRDLSYTEWSALVSGPTVTLKCGPTDESQELTISKQLLRDYTTLLQGLETTSQPVVGDDQRRTRKRAKIDPEMIESDVIDMTDRWPHIVEIFLCILHGRACSLTELPQKNKPSLISGVTKKEYEKMKPIKKPVSALTQVAALASLSAFVGLKTDDIAKVVCDEASHILTPDIVNDFYELFGQPIDIDIVFDIIAKIVAVDHVRSLCSRIRIRCTEYNNKYQSSINKHPELAMRVARYGLILMAKVERVRTHIDEITSRDLITGELIEICTRDARY